MAQTLTTLALAYEAAAKVLQRYQVPPAEVFQAAGIQPEPYRDPDARISTTRLRLFWAEAVRRTGSPCLGFEVGQALAPSNLHAIGYAWLSSRTLREALERLVRYQKLLSNAGTFRIETRADRTVLEIEPHAQAVQEGVDMALTGIIAICREVAHEEFNPERIEMVREAPSCARELRRWFGAPVKWGQPRNLISFDAAQLGAHLPRQVPALARASDEVARRYIAAMDRNDVVARARTGLMDILANGEPSRAALAARLHMSERSLARRLAERGISFRQVLDSTRKELAIAYLEQGTHSIADLTYLLGFSDQSNFARSFRRWTGQSPSAFRASLAHTH